MAAKPGLSPSAGLAATARDLSRTSENHVYAKALKAIDIFCVIGAVVALLFATNGLDMSVGFF